MKSLFCGFCIQFKVNPLMASQVLPTESVQKVIKLQEKLLSSVSFKFYVVYVNREIKKSLEKTRNLYQKTENHLSCCSRLSVNFCIVCKIISLKRGIEIHFSTVEQFFERKLSRTFTKQHVPLLSF